ncbi:hypothetical protein ACIBG0_26615 [Nocardia sp. NPDC050630]|uniref:AMP-binding enzyme n=1 Tax=Nocardia sp. NPDC050630 TaxID=3364321 RepID=UPI00378B8677
MPSAELEVLLLTHPMIVDAAISVKDAEGEGIPKAFVVRQSDTDLDAKQVIDHVAERVAPYKGGPSRRIRLCHPLNPSRAGSHAKI